MAEISRIVDLYDFINPTDEQPANLAIDVGIRACEENYRAAFRTAAGLINEMVEARSQTEHLAASCGVFI